MLIKKAEKLQIRIESELLERFRAMSEQRGVHASLMLRHIMTVACQEHEEKARKHKEWLKKQTERKNEHCNSCTGGKKIINFRTKG